MRHEDENTNIMPQSRVNSSTLSRPGPTVMERKVRGAKASWTRSNSFAHSPRNGVTTRNVN